MAIAALAESRPTAVNLFWALQRMEGVLRQCRSREDAVARLAEEAIAIHREDLAANMAMADLALAAMALDKPCAVLTHCNTGALATGAMVPPWVWSAASTNKDC